MFTYLFNKHVIVSVPNEISHNHNTLANRSKRIFFSNITIYTQNILRFYAYLPKKHFAISENNNLYTSECSFLGIRTYIFLECSCKAAVKQVFINY
jgi:hypothetical protein